ncbi:oxidoreductase domain protein [Thermocrinis albus DSM 14484]|uniref:Oxidoreductase domain protein n=1 Tax=Thermocrinis albus (strain DSM 14484 / JCM 11386 / HI 11/12) TaxID=638303 RepID=D3SN46_THEAH|nr:Gfo/Idh/MocA family oxidoreductase [Thermocrinis albus]ADC90176.1 oxidoreductase domain protein [Thermocrinis albus DSM 14484]
MKTLGVIGAGSFARFGVEAVAELKDVVLAAVAAPTPSHRKQVIEVWRARRRALGFKDYHRPVEEYSDGVQLVMDPNIDLVWVAVPPHLQPIMAKRTLEASKLLLLEKPGATHPSLLEPIIKKQSAAGCVNLVQRNMLPYRLLKTLLEQQAFGKIDALFVVNYAKAPPKNHWFWDRHKSGGVLVEHGVHFFDLASWLLSSDPVKVTLQEDHVGKAMAVVEYHHVKAVFYHAFILEEGEEYQFVELVGDRGRVRVRGWVPTKMEIHTKLSDIALFLKETVEKIPEEAHLPPYKLTKKEDHWELVVEDSRSAYMAAIRLNFIALLKGLSCPSLEDAFKALKVATGII